MTRLLFIAASILAVWYVFSGPDGPELTDAGYRYPGYSVRALEPFEMEARVLSRRDYRRGREADLSPTDLALGWGPVAEDRVADALQVSQSGRWYRWKVAQYPIPRRAIEKHSANMHMIPANPEAAEALSRVERHDQVLIEGQLVEVQAEDGWRWRSSLTRNDTGNGACEVVYLESLTIL